MAVQRPPVIPEIAKAYENDPRTKLALQAIAAGTSNAPVAKGNAGYMDGIARVLQAGMGGYFNNQQQGQYGDEESQLLAQRQQRGVDGLNGTGTPTPPPGPPPGALAAGLANGAALANGPPPPSAPPPVPPPAGALPPSAGPPPGAMPPSVGTPPAGPVPTNAGAVASALGAPPVAGPSPGGPPMIPTGPIPAPGAPAVMGGSPQGRPPFAQGSASGAVPPTQGPINPPYLQAPVMQPVPNGPAPVARPVAPDAVGPVQSKQLNAAYHIMADANPYESAQGQDMYATGLSDQDKLNEAAAQRKQALATLGYQSDLGQYGEAQNQDRSAAIQDRQSAIARNAAAQTNYGNQQFEYGVHKDDQTFQGTQKGLDRSNALQLEGMRAASAMAVEKVKAAATEGGGTALSNDERAALSTAVGDGRIDLKGITKFQAKVVAQSLIDNPGLNAVQLHANAVLAANPPAQQKAMLVAAVPTLLNNVRQAGSKLNFSDAQFVGKLQAFGKGQLNDPDFINYMGQRNDAMQTLSSVMRNTGATDLSTKLESDAAPKTMSPKAWDAWYQGQMAAVMPRVQMYEKRGLLPQGTAASLTAAAPALANTAPPATPGGWGKATVVGQ